jgi:hypothetical protein
LDIADEATLSDGVSGSELWPCGNNQFACDPNSCNVSFSVPEGTLVVNKALSSALSLSAATTTATATATSIKTVTVTPAATTIAVKGTISTGDATAIGAGIGVPLLIALTAALVFLFRERRKRRVIRPTSYPSEHTPALEGYRQQIDGRPIDNNKPLNVHELGPEYRNFNDGANRGTFNELDSTSRGGRHPYDPPR